MHCPFVGQIQRMTHDDYVTHIAIYIHVAPRVACPHLTSVDVQRHGWFEMEEAACSTMVFLVFLWLLYISTRLVGNSDIAYLAICREW